MSATGLYAADGSININVITSSYVGLYGSNGAWNVISSLGFGYEDPPTGALRVTLTSTPVNSLYAPDGSMYVSVSPYVANTLKVTVLTGSFGSSGSYYVWIFI